MNKLISIFLLIFLLISSNAFAELSLSDLEFKQEDIKLDPGLSKLMDQRHDKLQLHQKFGIATALAMTTTVFLGDGAKKNVTAHEIAGITTGLLYWTTAYFAWSAPKPDIVKDTGSTQIHRLLSYIHVPLMALAPVLGYLHHQNDKKAERSSGLVNAHGGIATAAYLSFMAAGLTMYFDF